MRFWFVREREREGGREGGREGERERGIKMVCECIKRDKLYQSVFEPYDASCGSEFPDCVNV